jgi:hypothetical protein
MNACCPCIQNYLQCVLTLNLLAKQVLDLLGVQKVGIQAKFIKGFMV